MEYMTIGKLFATGFLYAVPLTVVTGLSSLFSHPSYLQTSLFLLGVMLFPFSFFMTDVVFPLSSWYAGAIAAGFGLLLSFYQLVPVLKQIALFVLMLASVCVLSSIHLSYFPSEYDTMHAPFALIAQHVSWNFLSKQVQWIVFLFFVYYLRLLDMQGNKKRGVSLAVLIGIWCVGALYWADTTVPSYAFASCVVSFILTQWCSVIARLITERHHV